MASEFQLLTKQQFNEIERQLVAAETEVWGQMHKRLIEATPAIADLQFKSLEYIRRLEDHKKLVAALEQLAPWADAESIARAVLVESDT